MENYKSYYREVAKKFEETNLKLYEVLVADCANCYEGIAELGDEGFDIICRYIYDWVMDTEATPDEVASVINGILEDKEFNVVDFHLDSEELRETINRRI